jgi:F420-dependent oxidoreductase-like protein
MRLCIFIEPQQGADFEDQLAVARRTEECGFDGFFRSDHFLVMGTRSGLPGPTDAWVTLGAIARETSRVRLGTLVSSATFRLPGMLAITAAQVDRMSGGRLELGLGAGWYEEEHTAYGVPFPPVKERFDRLEEQLEIITGLWSDTESFSFTGQHYTVDNSPGLPKPAQRPGPPIIIGGKGPKRTPALAAKYATEFNVAFSSLADTAAQFERVRGVADRKLVLSAAQTVVVGRTDAEVARRVEAIGTAASRAIAGTPERVAEGLRAFADAGAERLFLQILDMADLDHLDVIASDVAPLL